MKKVRFVGLDVHADTIAVAVASRAAALPPRNEVGAKRGHHGQKAFHVCTREQFQLVTRIEWFLPGVFLAARAYAA